MNKSYLFLAVFFVFATKSESRPLYLAQSAKSGTKKDKPAKTPLQRITSSKALTAAAKNSSQTLTVKTTLKQYTLKHDKNKISIKGYQLDLSLSRKRCNAHIINRFNNELTKFIKEQIKTNTLQKIVEKVSIETVEVHIDREIYFINAKSKAGSAFLFLPNEIIRMKWEEKIECSKKK